MERAATDRTGRHIDVDGHAGQSHESITLLARYATDSKHRRCNSADGDICLLQWRSKLDDRNYNHGPGCLACELGNIGTISPPYRTIHRFHANSHGAAKQYTANHRTAVRRER